MKRFHLPSFLCGAASGLIVLVLFFGSLRVLGFSGRTARFGGTTFQGPNLARMAERMGISESDLQKELDAGKSMQEIAKEHGITMGNFGNRGGNRSASLSAGTGSVRSASSSSAAASIR